MALHRNWLASVLLLGGMLQGYANAVMVTVDPGSIGSTSEFLSADFSELNGTAVNGQSVTVDVLFEEAKQVEFTSIPNTDQVLVGLEITLDAAFDPQLPGATGSLTEGYLTDLGGNSITPLPDQLSAAPTASPGNLTDILAYDLSWFASPPFPLGSLADLLNKPFHDVHFIFELPTLTDVSITDARFFILGSGDLGDTFIRVRSVPEPATLMLLGIGLAGLGWLTRRRANASSRRR